MLVEIDDIIKDIQQQIKNIKESNRNQMYNEIEQIKQKYRNKIKEETEKLKLELKKERYKKFYNETYGRIEKQPTKRDVVAIELFKQQYIQCSIQQKKIVNAKLTQIYRQKRKGD